MPHAALVLVFAVILFVLLWWLLSQIPDPQPNTPPQPPFKKILFILLIVLAIIWLVFIWGPMVGVSLLG